MFRTQLVVADDNVLGYIQPQSPNVVGVLHASVLKGSTLGRLEGWIYRSQTKTIRLATERDFKEFRVEFDGYRNDPNRYEWNNGEGEI